ncbi:FG-GAP and VCBS repeat-containing protein [bacterium]|nr:FG-GAP and VCBS repeat-containing protein [bacterium]
MRVFFKASCFVVFLLSGIEPVFAQSGTVLFHERPALSDEGRLGVSIQPIRDLDGDGVTDYVLGLPSAPPLPPTRPHTGLVRVMSGRTHSILRDLPGPARGPIGLPTQYGVNVQVADWNGDGVEDIVLPAPGAGVQAEGVISIVNGRTGTLLFQYAGSAPFRQAGEEVVVSDLNGDGQQDLVVLLANPRQVVAISGQNGGILYSVSTPSGATLGFPASFAVADLAGGAGQELVIADSGTSVVPGALYFFDAASGALQFQLPRSVSGEEYGASLAVGDLNGDGRSDLVVGAPGSSPSHPAGHIDVLQGGTLSSLYQEGGRTPGDRFGGAVTVRPSQGGQPSLIAVFAERSAGNGELSLHRGTNGVRFESIPSTGARFGLPMGFAWGEAVEGSGEANFLLGDPSAVPSGKLSLRTVSSTAILGDPSPVPSGGHLPLRVVGGGVVQGSLQLSGAGSPGSTVFLLASLPRLLPPALLPAGPVYIGDGFVELAQTTVDASGSYQLGPFPFPFPNGFVLGLQAFDSNGRLSNAIFVRE